MGEPTVQVRLQGVTYERFKEAFVACESVIFDYNGELSERKKQRDAI